jgi:hypothetical protein
VSAELQSQTSVTLLGRHELDPAVAVLVVGPGDERSDPLTGLIFGGGCFAGKSGRSFTVLNSASEYGLSLLMRGLAKDLSTPG